MRIVMTGGGSAGHVTPNLALLPALRRMNFDIHYIGTKDGIERRLVEHEGLTYHAINAGKLRRYFAWRNLSDPFRAVQGVGQSVAIIRRLKPDVIFAKGGFVSLPVVIAAWATRIPCVIHESDFTPGLANRLATPFAARICYTFPETAAFIRGGKGILTGIPVRASLLQGDAARGRSLCKFEARRPVLTVFGGSQGSRVINAAVRASLDELLAKFQVCHVCGKGGIDASLSSLAGYCQFEYLNEEQPDVFAATDIFVSRAGATSLFEILALRKPNLLIPLSRRGSRGDQILNAESFEKQGFSAVLPEEQLTPKTLVQQVAEAFRRRDTYLRAMAASQSISSVDRVLAVIEEAMAK